MTTDHTAYWAKREAQERAIADRTADPVARRLHLDLAELCAAKHAPVPTPQAA